MSTREANQTRMAANWHPSEGFEALADRINMGIQYAQYADKPIADGDIVDIAKRIIKRCGLFPEEYKEWITQDGKMLAQKKNLV